jgi:hypothetical protein
VFGSWNRNQTKWWRCKSLITRTKEKSWCS